MQAAVLVKLGKGLVSSGAPGERPQPGTYVAVLGGQADPVLLTGSALGRISSLLDQEETRQARCREPVDLVGVVRPAEHDDIASGDQVRRWARPQAPCGRTISSRRSLPVTIAAQRHAFYFSAFGSPDDGFCHGVDPEAGELEQHRAPELRDPGRIGEFVAATVHDVEAVDDLVSEGGHFGVADVEP